MAKTYTTVPTKTSGDTITVTNWTTHLQTNINNMIVKPVALVRRAANQSIANITLDNIEFDTEEVDTDSMVDLATNDEIITINTAGIYICTASVQWATGTATHREATITDGSSNIIAEDTSERPPLGDKTHAISSLWEFAASDTVKLRVYHADGSAHNVTEATLAVCWLSKAS